MGNLICLLGSPTPLDPRTASLGDLAAGVRQAIQASPAAAAAHYKWLAETEAAGKLPAVPTFDLFGFETNLNLSQWDWKAQGLRFGGHEPVFTFGVVPNTIYRCAGMRHGKRVHTSAGPEEHHRHPLHLLLSGTFKMRPLTTLCHFNVLCACRKDIPTSSCAAMCMHAPYTSDATRRTCVLLEIDLSMTSSCDAASLRCVRAGTT